MRKSIKRIGVIAMASIACTACSQETKPPVETKDSVTDVKTKGPDEETEKSISYYPENLDNPKNLPVLRWMVVNGMSTMKTSVATELNKKLEQAGRPYRVQFIFVQNEDSEIPEEGKDADLMSVFGDTAKNKELAKSGYYMPLNDYLDSKDGKALKELLMAEDVSSLRSAMNGTIYGIPWLYTMPNCQALAVEPKVIEEYQMDTDELQEEFFALNNVFEKIYQKNGEKGFIFIPDGFEGKESDIAQVEYPSIFQALTFRYEMLTSCIGIDMKSGKAVNVYKSDYLKKIWRAWKEYENKGYLTTNESNALVNPNCTAYSKINVELEDGSYLIPGGELFANRSVSSFALGVGIVQTSEQTVQALDFLSLIHIDEEMRNLLAYGIEGEDYTVQDGVAVSMEDGYYEYGLIFGEEFGSITRAESSFLYPEISGETRKETYQKTLRQTNSYPYKDVTFELSAVQSKIDATEAVMQEFFERFNLKQYEEKDFDNLNQQLETAGIQDIIEEINKQTGYKTDKK